MPTLNNYDLFDKFWINSRNKNKKLNLLWLNTTPRKRSYTDCMLSNKIISDVGLIGSNSVNIEFIRVAESPAQFHTIMYSPRHKPWVRYVSPKLL